MVNFKVSVLISTYNSGYYLKLAVDSILNQTIGFENIELIIADDKSDDDYTIRLLEEYENNYSNCKVFILDEHTGFPGKPRNVAFENATGEYVIFMDSDDTYSLDAFEVMYETAVSEDYDFVITTFKRILSNRVEFYQHPDFLNQEVYRFNSVEDDLNLLKLQPSLWARLIKRDFLIENNITSVEGVNAQDLEFVVHTLLCATNFVYLSRFPAYNYSIRDMLNDKSSIRDYKEKLLKGLIDGYFATYDLLRKFDKESYFSIFFQSHIYFYLDIMSKSSVIDHVKIDLIKEFSPILKKQFELSPNFANNLFAPIKDDLFTDSYEELIKKLNKNHKAILEADSIYELFYKNENFNTLRFCNFNTDEYEVCFSPLHNRRFYSRCSITNIDTDFDVYEIIALNAVCGVKSSEQIFSNSFPIYKITGDFSKGTFMEITFTLCEISEVEFNSIKVNKNLKRKNKKLSKKNKKLNKKLNFYNNLLDTKPYRLARIFRNFAKKIRHLKSGF